MAGKDDAIPIDQDGIGEAKLTKELVPVV